MQIKAIFISMVSHLDSLWNRGARELGNGQLHFSYLTFSISRFMLPEFAHGSSWHMNWLVHRRRTYALDIYNESHMRPPHKGPSAYFPSTLSWRTLLPWPPLTNHCIVIHSIAVFVPAVIIGCPGATQLRRWWIGFYPNPCKVKACKDKAHCSLVRFS